MGVVVRSLHVLVSTPKAIYCNQGRQSALHTWEFGRSTHCPVHKWSNTGPRNTQRRNHNPVPTSNGQSLPYCKDTSDTSALVTESAKAGTLKNGQPFIQPLKFDHRKLNTSLLHSALDGRSSPVTFLIHWCVNKSTAVYSVYPGRINSE